MPFEVKSYLRYCEATLRTFKKEEEKERPENALLLRTPHMINAKFKKSLDEIKFEAGFVPEEVYISTSFEGVIFASFGSTLLDIQVVFRLPLDVRVVSRKHKEENKSFSYEREVVKEYNRCLRHFNSVRRELKQAYNARAVPAGELVQAMRFAEEAHFRALAKASTFSTNKFSNTLKKQAHDEVNSLRQLIFRLRQLSSKRA